MTSAPFIVFAGGGTGGHLFPTLAVASEIRTEEPNARFVFLGTDRAIDREVLREAGESLIPQRVQPLRLRKPWTLPRFMVAWSRSRRQCRSFLASHRPSVVVGSGGFGSGPALCEARRAGIPTALLNPDAVPGRANRFLASRADAIFAQWEESAAHFDGRSVVQVTGCPVRRSFRSASREAGYARFGLDPDRRTLLVTGASQGARSINQALLAMMESFASVPDWQILHLSGPVDDHRLADAYAAQRIPATVVSFTEHMADALATADLVVSRAGASILAEITAVGRPSVLMPYPHHRDQHQVHNARVLVKRGAARMVRDQVDAQVNGPNLRRALLPLLADESARSELAREAQRLGRPDAASVVAGEILALTRSARWRSADVKVGGTEALHPIQ
jgi:UDP-N-acetylglucosamine--N-acetylmuramyl-(pentapeptide) pyrophosphoryl-undecaprenol N-acetylglucosamine transferase